jgi:hypothetical protein
MKGNLNVVNHFPYDLHIRENFSFSSHESWVPTAFINVPSLSSPDIMNVFSSDVARQANRYTHHAAYT